MTRRMGLSAAHMLTLLLDGVAYGMLLFVLSAGLAVTLGLMNFINLAHGAFAMLGGYVTALLMNRAGVPFLATLPLAFLIPASVGVVLERTLYRRLYGASPLDQVLFTIGLVFMAMPAANYPARRSAAADPSARLPARPARIPRRQHRRLSAVHDPAVRRHRGGVADLPRRHALRRAAARRGRRCARRLRARRQRRSPVRRHLRGRQRACRASAARWPADVVGGIDPSFPLKYLVIMLIVVTIGGANGILGALFGALLLGVLDVAGKYYVPSIGAFIIYAVMVATLILRPRGLFAKGDGR